MKSKIYTLFFGILFLSIPVFAQKTIVVVEPDPGIEIGALNDAIAGAADPGNTIFELRRDGVYYLNGAISHSGYTLHIRAKDEAGQRPVLLPAVDDLGVSANHFNPNGSFILEGIHIHGIDELGAVPNRLIICGGADTKIIIDDCYFDYSNQSFVRLTATNIGVSITNSILRNCWRTENPDNGRIIDTRGNPCDTLIIENSTMYNNSEKILSGAFYSPYVKFNHNTVFQANLESNFSLEAALKADVTNNIFYNFAMKGRDFEHAPLFYVDSMLTRGGEDKTDADRYFNLSNNNWYTDQAIHDVLDEYAPDTMVRYDPADVDSVTPIPWRWIPRENIFARQEILDTLTVTAPPYIILFIDNGQVTAENIFKEKLVFDNPPALKIAYWAFFAEHDFEIGSYDPPSPFADEDSIVLGEVTTGAFTFNYNDNAISATAAEGGLPLGDPRWVPYSTVSTRDIDALSGSAVRAYPNPFNSQLTFEITVKMAGPVNIRIYDLVGKEVSSVNENLNAGHNTVPVAFSSHLNSGIYLYKVQTGSNKTIASGKLIKR